MHLWNCCEPSHTDSFLKNLSDWIQHNGRFEPSPNERHRSSANNFANMERALASFHAAVAEEYGAEQAALAAQDWIEELHTMSADAQIDWRSVTGAAARRLARRVVQPMQA